MDPHGTTAGASSCLREAMPETEIPEPWALLPSEVVCPTCHLAHHKYLPACPTCTLEDRVR